MCCRVPRRRTPSSGDADGLAPGAPTAGWLALATAAALFNLLNDWHLGRVLLRRVRGIGVWTAAEIAQRAWGDPDAVSFGDFHVPNTVGWALLGHDLDDAGMLEVLAPYVPQRQRAVRYIEASGFRRPRFGPRFSPRDYRSF